jgi:hypothetical protein
MPSEGFEPAIPAIELPQNCAQPPGPTTCLRTHMDMFIYVIILHLNIEIPPSSCSWPVSEQVRKEVHAVYGKWKFHSLLQQVPSWVPVPVLSPNNRLCALPSLLTYILTHSLTHSLTYSLTHSLNHSLTHLLKYLLTYSLTHSFTHSLTHSLTRLLTYSLTHSLTYLLIYTLTHSLTYLLTYSLIHSLTYLLT